MSSTYIVFKLIKSKRELANSVGVSPQAVNRWYKTGQIPVRRVLDVEKALNGAVTRYELRPDIFGTAPPVRQ